MKVFTENIGNCLRILYKFGKPKTKEGNRKMRNGKSIKDKVCCVVPVWGWSHWHRVDTGHPVKRCPATIVKVDEKDKGPLPLGNATLPFSWLFSWCFYRVKLFPYLEIDLEKNWSYWRGVMGLAPHSPSFSSTAPRGSPWEGSRVVKGAQMHGPLSHLIPLSKAGQG